MNRERQAVQGRLLELALARLTEPVPAFLVVWGPEAEGWHRGVVGIVAARLRDRLHRPAAVVAVTGDGAVGSVRSIPEVHAVRALEGAAELLTRFGGHAAAAGFSLPAQHLPELQARLSSQVEQMLEGELPVPCHTAELRLGADALGRALQTELARLGPHGKGNPQPRIWVEAAELEDLRVLKDKHLKGILPTAGGPVEVVWWGAAEHHGALAGASVELLGRLGVNRWQGRERLQLSVEDARPASSALAG